MSAIPAGILRPMGRAKLRPVTGPEIRVSRDPRPRLQIPVGAL